MREFKHWQGSRSRTISPLKRLEAIQTRFGGDRSHFNLAWYIAAESKEGAGTNSLVRLPALTGKKAVSVKGVL